MMDLSKREFSVLVYLYKVKIASIDQLRRDVFSDTGERWMFRVLKRLFQGELITKRYVDQPGFRRGFQLSKKAMRKYKPVDAKVPWREIESHCPIHDLILNDIRYHLNGFEEVKEYFTENEIKSKVNYCQTFPVEEFYCVNPDGGAIVHIKGKDRYIAIEFERNIKGHDRYLQLLRAYYSKPTISAVIYIFDDLKMLHSVQADERALIGESESKVFFLELDQLFKTKRRIKLCSSTNLSFELTKKVPETDDVQGQLERQLQSQVTGVHFTPSQTLTNRL
jgi:hypothetical protein